MKPKVLLQSLLRRQPAVFTFAITLTCSALPAAAATCQWNGSTDPDSATSNNATPTEEITVDLPEVLLAKPTLFIRVRAVKP